MIFKHTPILQSLCRATGINKYKIKIKIIKKKRCRINNFLPALLYVCNITIFNSLSPPVRPNLNSNDFFPFSFIQANNAYVRDQWYHSIIWKVFPSSLLLIRFLNEKLFLSLMSFFHFCIKEKSVSVPPNYAKDNQAGSVT